MTYLTYLYAAQYERDGADLYIMIIAKNDLNASLVADYVSETHHLGGTNKRVDIIAPSLELSIKEGYFNTEDFDGNTNYFLAVKSPFVEVCVRSLKLKNILPD